MKKIGIALCVCLLLASAAGAEEPVLESLEDRASYGLGFSLGNQWLAQGVPLDIELLIAGLRDGLSGATGRLSAEQIGEALQELQTRMMEEAAAKNRAAGESFLAENGARPEVVTLESGLQYEVLTAGEGDSPSVADRVTVHYRGTLIDGTVFDSSYDRGEPVTIALNQVIPGWQQALPLMKVGSKWKLFIPSDLAYGPGGSGSVIGPDATLVFEVELVDVNAADAE